MITDREKKGSKGNEWQNFSFKCVLKKGLFECVKTMNMIIFKKMCDV